MGHEDSPTLRVCMHALRGSGADAASASKFAADIDALHLSKAEWEGLRNGLRPLRKIDLRIDRIMESRLPPEGAYALGICVALFGEVGLRIQKKSQRKAAPILREAAELIPVAIVALGTQGEPDPSTVKDRLERLRRRIDRAGIDTGAFGRVAKVSRSDLPTVEGRGPDLKPTGIPAKRLLAAAVALVVLIVGLIAVALPDREGEVDVTIHQDLLPVQELTRRTGEVRLRVPFGWGVDEREAAEAAAIEAWRREIGEADDLGIILKITTGQGRVVATVERGEVRWTLE